MFASFVCTWNLPSFLQCQTKCGTKKSVGRADGIAGPPFNSRHNIGFWLTGEERLSLQPIDNFSVYILQYVSLQKSYKNGIPDEDNSQVLHIRHVTLYLSAQAQGSTSAQ